MRARITILVLLVAALGLIVSLILRTRRPAPAPAPAIEEALSSPLKPGSAPAQEPPSASPGTAAATGPNVPPPAPVAGAPPAPAGETRAPETRQPRPDPRVGRTADGRTILKQPFDLSRQLHAPETGPQEDLEILDQILFYYRKLHGENPVVESEHAVLDALTGTNPKQVVLFDPDHPEINQAGELLDRFGNPYYFHSISGDTMDIVSPGPDGIRGTPDDIHYLENEDADAD